MIRLSKILSYLIDNLYIAMLSPIKEWGQGQRGGPEAPLPDLELFAKDGRNKIGNVRLSRSFLALLVSSCDRSSRSFGAHLKDRSSYSRRRRCR
jgi:hypothetical protein